MQISTRGAASVAAAVALVFGTQLAVSPVAQATPPLMPASDNDGFYAHGDLAQYKPGDVIKVRDMPAPPGFFNVNVTQIQYRSTNSAGEPISAVTTVLAPLNKVSNGPLLSYQHIVNALGTRCAPSKTLYTDDPDLQIREAVGLTPFSRKDGRYLFPTISAPPAPTEQRSSEEWSLSTVFVR